MSFGRDLNAEIRTAHQDGVTARRQGKPMNTNVYNSTDDLVLAVAWQQGWLEEDRHLRIHDYTPLV